MAPGISGRYSFHCGIYLVFEPHFSRQLLATPGQTMKQSRHGSQAQCFFQKYLVRVSVESQSSSADQMRDGYSDTIFVYRQGYPQINTVPLCSEHTCSPFFANTVPFPSLILTLRFRTSTHTRKSPTQPRKTPATLSIQSPSSPPSSTSGSWSRATSPACYRTNHSYCRRGR